MIMKCTFFFFTDASLVSKGKLSENWHNYSSQFSGLLHCNYFKKVISLYWSKQLQWEDLPEERRETWLKTYALPRILIR